MIGQTTYDVTEALKYVGIQFEYIYIYIYIYILIYIKYNKISDTNEPLQKRLMRLMHVINNGEGSHTIQYTY